MRLVTLEIENFRAIRKALFTDLGHTVVIAGPNGCGKSAVLDAIRLLKSAGGEYRQGELQHFFSEFGIPVRDRVFTAANLARDSTTSLKISGAFTLSPSEIDYLKKEAASILRPFVVRVLAPSSRDGEPTIVRDKDDFWSKIDERLTKEIDEFTTLLDSTDTHSGTLESDPETGLLSYSGSDVLSVLFCTFDPGNLGIFDFHGANRIYIREQLNQITIGKTEKDTRSQHA